MAERALSPSRVVALAAVIRFEQVWTRRSRRARLVQMSVIPESDVRQRAQLVREQERFIRRSVARAPFAADELVVVVLDTEDAVARELAGTILASAAELKLDPDDARLLAKPELAPTSVAAIPLAAARAGFGASHPLIAEGLVPPSPPGKVRVVVVAAGGATLVHVAV
jgi:hypothetical protein